MTVMLKDTAARVTAMTTHDVSLLVEAGAGSGKTAVMAGRVACMIASGVEPKSIAAVTYTELAAGELMSRIRDFVEALSIGDVPPELGTVFPTGVSAEQRATLQVAADRLDEITCTTIHGFCQRLITPYPVEANIDPGASIMDRAQADLMFVEIVEAWLREQLSVGSTGLLAEMVLRDPTGTVTLVHGVIRQLREKRTLSVVPHEAVGPLVDKFIEAVTAFQSFLDGTGVVEEDTAAITEGFLRLADKLQATGRPERPEQTLDFLFLEVEKVLVTENRTFRKFQKKGKWESAAKACGYSKADGLTFFGTAEGHYAKCCALFDEMRSHACSWVLSELVRLAKGAVEKFQDYKRASAYLDFDDLIFSARDLLRGHESVRGALSLRYAHLLVDEFQDTDPLQTEIIWRLCGDPVDEKDDWRTFKLRPGALFVVGDPKQAIYRFRGADVGVYISAKKLMGDQGKSEVVSIATNFRSTETILEYVNARFAQVLSVECKQPGFTRLDPFHEDVDGALHVAAIDVPVADENGKASLEAQRDAEAEEVAKLCAGMIGNYRFLDRKTRETRLCRPGDIALLAPQGTELWRYEEALERHGISVATQAGKGLFKRQEIQDLIAITRVLADPSDTLALGALLRGPLVGLADEEILDIIWSLPRPADNPDELPRLNIRVSAADIGHALARSVFERLQALAKVANSTSPHDLLSQAVDSLRVRPILLRRHSGQAERALANVDLYLHLARSYDVRGLRAFAEAMTGAWTDESKAVEGRPDAQEDSVGLFTIHSAKGLEWNMVVVVNSMTGQQGIDPIIVDRTDNVLHCPVFKIKPTGYEQAHAAEEEETIRERIRLWYVATTRARELMILPRLDIEHGKKAWCSLVDLAVADLPAIDVASFSKPGRGAAAISINGQSRETFAAESGVIEAKRQRIIWEAPSRNEADGDDVPVPDVAYLFRAGEDEANTERPESAVKGGRARGLVIHKLLEEILNGESAPDVESLQTRAGTLLSQLGHRSRPDASAGFSADEIAACVTRTLAIPQIQALRDTLVPEFTVYGHSTSEDTEVLMTGVADCISFDESGRAQVVIDWKSDVAPSSETIATYTRQVRDYVNANAISKGLIVFVTSGQVLEVEPYP